MSLRGLTLDRELQMSHEAGAQLHSLTGSMNDKHGTLRGALVLEINGYFIQSMILSTWCSIQ
jgi:hypothetical protein